MRIHDITTTIREGMATWPGDPAVQVELIASLQAGDRVDVSRLVLGTHSGTHVDAPSHVLPGARAVDELSLKHLLGPADVVALPGRERVGAQELATVDLPADCHRVLFKTRNSDSDLPALLAFDTNFCAFHADAAPWLQERGFMAVGIDGPSVDPYDSESKPVHRALLEQGVILIEGLDLRGIEPGRYELVCLPLRIAGADGAPARVLLIESEDGIG